MSPFESLLLGSRRVLALVLGLVLLVLATVVGLATLQLRHQVRAQIAGRDGAVLQAVALMNFAEEVKEGLALSNTDPGIQLGVALRSSQLRGVLGVRIYTPEGHYVGSFPPEVTEQPLAHEHLAVLGQLQPSTRFHARMPMGELFYPGKNEASTGRVAVLEVNVPLNLPGGQAAGIAQFLVEGQSIAAEYARLDRQLAWQAAVALLAGGGLLSVSMGWAFQRLRRAHRLVAERTENLLRANQELALAARTSALGAVAGHLIHGLKNPLAGLHNYVSSRATPPEHGPDGDWQQALASTRRMQAMVRQVVGVLHEESSGAGYEITPAELEQMVRARLDPLAQAQGVSFQTSIQSELARPNRVANLLALILINLGENALQATPKGKSVTLTLRDGPAGLIAEVHDQGPGFPAEVPLFSPCLSAREGGTGIGLALCKQLANHLGAELALTHSGSDGCVFTLVLPARCEHPAELAAVP